MKNKRGFIMFIYLVMLTLLMVGIVFLISFNDNKELSVSLVSPMAILEIKDSLSIFEMRELELINKSLTDVNFGNNGFEDKFFDEFIGGINEEMKNFIFSDLIWKGAVIKGDIDEDVFLKKVLYSVDFSNDVLVLERSEIGKRKLLLADEDARVKFPVDFSFEFKRNYEIKRVGNKILIEKL